MIRPKGLGRGLDALLASAEDAPASKDALQMVPIDRLRPGKYQPRSRMDDASLDDLAASIREQGVMQPILVRTADAGGYEIIAGERRWRASQRAGLAQVPVLIKSVPDQAALALSLIENIQREDLNPLEEAQGLQRLIEEFGLTHEAAAKAVGRSRSGVSNLLRLNQLAKPVQEYLLGHELEMGHARALLALPVAQQPAAATRIVELAMSVREAERHVHRLLEPAQAAKRKPRATLDADTLRLENDLAEALGANVKLEPGRKGAGRIVILYSSLEQLDGLLEKMR